MRRVGLIGLIALCLFTLTACGAAQRSVPGVVRWGTITAKPTIVGSPAKAAISIAPTIADMSTLDIAADRWQAFGISDYRLTVSEEGAFSLIIRYTITVRAGQIVEQSRSCSPPSSGSCKAQSRDATNYTVPGLFARIRTLLLRNASSDPTGKQGPSCKPQVAYDPVYSFPRAIYCDDPRWSDDQITIGISEFILLPPE